MNFQLIDHIENERHLIAITQQLVRSLFYGFQLLNDDQRSYDRCLVYKYSFIFNL